MQTAEVEESVVRVVGLDTPVETAYGVFIDIRSEDETIKAVLRSNAKKKVEVAVRWKDETKEFTFADFFRRLGFYEDKKEETSGSPT